MIFITWHTSKFKNTVTKVYNITVTKVCYKQIMFEFVNLAMVHVISSHGGCFTQTVTGYLIYMTNSFELIFQKTFHI